ncbi:spindle assembly abnormal protein 6 homolog [Diadema setosum]|uniref:spindle assembly abnormal protein 6 homolog n=1 Tax=Diadema setosum TaxID=31175 RepID=UPI003B3A7356
MDSALFDQILTVVFKSQGQDDRSVGIRIAMQIVSVTSPIHRKELHVRLTDDKDPFFLYDLHLGEEDFQVLKNQQGLLVDFSAFPQKFIELLRLCAESQGQENGKFVLQLIQAGDGRGLSQSLAQLSVVETNPFKHLTHLSLSLKPGTDTEVKQYLAKCLNSLQEDHRQLKTHLASRESSLTHQLQQTQELLETRSSELERLRGQWSSQTDSQSARHQQEMSEERQKALQTQREMEKTWTAQRQELEDKHRHQLDKMQSRMSELQAVNREMHDRRQAQESTIKELRSKLYMIEEDFQRAQRELQSTRRHTDQLETEQTDREQTVGQLRTRVAVLEQEVRDKQALADKSSQLLDAATENKAQLEESLHHKKALILKLEGSLKSASQEVLKGNEIIRKLQGELKAAMAKMKLKNAVTSKQEKLLEERSQTLHRTEEERDGLKKKAESLETENERLKESIERMTSKLEESKQLLKTNENVITWLNKQVNEAQLSQRHGTVDPSRPPPITSYKPVAGTLHHAVGAPTTSYGMMPRPAFTSTPATNSSVPLNTPQSGLSALTRTSEASPALDPKYLQKQDPPVVAAPAPPLPSHHQLLAGVQRPKAPTQHPSQTHPLSQTHPPPSAPGGQVKPRPTMVQQGGPGGPRGSQGQPPLMSAYFPCSMQTAT